MSQFSIDLVKSFFAPIFPGMRKTHFENLSRSVFGLIVNHNGLLSDLVRGIPGAVKHKHRLKRLTRFLANPRIKPHALAHSWILWCVASLAPKGKWLPIAIDWTYLPGNIPCLMAAIPLGGRAMPLLWQMVPYKDFLDSQNKLEERFVRRVLFLLPPGIQPLLLADRGFGRADFLAFLRRLKISFVIRVRADVIITPEGKKPIKLREVALTPKRRRWYSTCLYREDGVVSGVNIAGTIAQGQDDAWWLATNLGSLDQAIRWYKARFQIEEWFKDMKHQLGLEAIQTTDIRRIRKLVFVACLAYGLLVKIGTLADQYAQWYDQLITGGKQAASVVWYALRLIQYAIPPPQFWQEVLDG
jgi:hypothetical protein